MSMRSRKSRYKSITIGVFHATSPKIDFLRVFDKIKELPLAKRNHPVFTEKHVHINDLVRVEDIERKGNLWMLNFALLKERGPGLANPEDPIVPANQCTRFRMFAYETTFLYPVGHHPGVVVVELGQRGRGVNPGMMKEYFSCVDRGCVKDFYSTPPEERYDDCFWPWRLELSNWFMHKSVKWYRETVPLPPIERDNRETAIKEERWDALIRVLHKFDNDMLKKEANKGIAEDPSVPK